MCICRFENVKIFECISWFEKLHYCQSRMHCFVNYCCPPFDVVIIIITDIFCFKDNACQIGAGSNYKEAIEK